jgi:tetratricopeptide (TPR) repeat protein
VYALQALALAGENKGNRAHPLGLLGTIERELGELEQSLAHIQEGLAIRRSVNMGLKWNLSELALTYLRMGSLAEAQQAAEQSVSLWEKHTGHRVQYQKDLWVLAQVYRALDEPERTQEMLAQAYTVMQELVAEIPEGEMKSAFLQLYYNRQIIAAYKRGEWPQQASHIDKDN